MAEPIMEFKDEAQAYECMKEWQARLFLNDWIIKVTQVNPDTVNIQGERMSGTNEYQVITKTAHIMIARGVTTCNELTLIHELLHCKFILTDRVSETTEGGFLALMEHQLIEDMAKSLIMAKYDLPFAWFRNF